MLPIELGEQLDIAFRLLVASVLGAAIGLERELHAHPAGMRTHLLVSLGSAAFTVLSIFFFETPFNPNGAAPTDPSRIAAQIVSGIGFLGAGAILKYGTSIRGLTTADAAAPKPKHPSSTPKPPDPSRSGPRATTGSSDSTADAGRMNTIERTRTWRSEGEFMP